MLKSLSIFNNLPFWLLIVLGVFIPLYPKFPFLNVPGTYVAVRAEDILILVTVLVWLAVNIKRFQDYFSQTIFRSFLFFWLVGGVSLLSALLITYSIQPHLGLLHWIRRVEYMSLFLIAATSIRSITQIKILLFTLLITTVAVMVYGFGQIFWDFPVISTTNKEFSKGLILYLTQGARVNSTFGGHYDLAIFLSMMIMIIGSVFFYLKNWILKGLLIVLGIAVFALLGLTAARVSFVATLVGLALVLWFHKQRLLLVCLIVLALGLIAIVPDLRHRLVATVTVNILQGGGARYNPAEEKVTIFTNLNRYPSNMRAKLKEQAVRGATMPGNPNIAADTVRGEPINTTELSVYRSWGIRFNVEWPRAIAAFLRNPALGTGYSSISIATDNDFLRSLGETGILGTLALMLIFFILFKHFWVFLKGRGSLKHSLSVGLFSLCATLFLTATFIDVLEASKVAEIFWLIMGVGWAVVGMDRETERLTND